MTLDSLEEMGKSLLEKLGSKEDVIYASGYFPATTALKLKSTFGLPLISTAIRCKQEGLKMDWDRISLEAARCGIDVDAEIAEAKHQLLLVA